MFVKRTNQLKSEAAYQVLGNTQKLEAEGREIIHLEIG